MKNIWAVVGVVLIVVLLLLVIGSVGMMGFAGHWGFGRGMMGGYGVYGMMGGLGLLGGLVRFGFCLLVLAGIALLVVWLARKSPTLPMGVSQTPLDILKARYAKGEVTKEQFDAMKKDLEA